MLCSFCNERPRVGKRSYCRECRNLRDSFYRRRYDQLTPEQKHKVRARAKAGYLQRRGILIPEPCAICGDPPQKHHPDYDQAAVVRWLCHPCHLYEHGTIDAGRWLELKGRVSSPLNTETRPVGLDALPRTAAKLARLDGKKAA